MSTPMFFVYLCVYLSYKHACACMSSVFGGGWVLFSERAYFCVGAYVCESTLTSMNVYQRTFILIVVLFSNINVFFFSHLLSFFFCFLLLRGVGTCAFNVVFDRTEF